MMRSTFVFLFIAAGCAAVIAQGEPATRCAEIAGMKIESVEITTATAIPAGATLPPAYPGAASVGPLPAHCRVDGMINRRKGVDGEEFGIGFALALPEAEAWNGDFMMQGGGGGNGVVALPVRARRIAGE